MGTSESQMTQPCGLSDYKVSQGRFFPAEPSSEAFLTKNKWLSEGDKGRAIITGQIGKQLGLLI